jgi:hypothetical protein
MRFGACLLNDGQFFGGDIDKRERCEIKSLFCGK